MFENQKQATTALASDRQQNLKHPFTPQLGAAAAAHRSGSSSTSRGRRYQQCSRAAAPHEPWPAGRRAFKLPATALPLHHSTSIGTLALHRLPPTLWSASSSSSSFFLSPYSPILLRDPSWHPFTVVWCISRPPLASTQDTVPLI
ncbi:uncharacterized protein PAN0_002c1206 [Moesziomyces antarcticus]|uniref:uncharacterized protein n=1 Tax=Pseudozyma antarctica TaxID=84753 RepID=UPI0007194B68|nr:uncharacterized protein PAN0_002c1206 [Moesziomyces antarcticus]GAK63004.1 hypothetical protein PAN0_002c1206 [Moesziomyces antarcticus]